MNPLTMILASIEAIPETTENYRERRDAIRGLKELIEAGK